MKPNYLIIAAAFIVSITMNAAMAGERVAVLVDEQVRGVFGVSGSWTDPGRVETTLISMLRDAGYEPVDPKALRSSVLHDQVVQVLSGDKKASIAVGELMQVPWLVIAHGYAKPAGNVAGSSMKSIQAQVETRMVDARTGQIMAEASASAAKPHVDEVAGGAEALATAVEKAGQELLTKLMSTQQQVSSDDHLTVDITGLRSYRQFLYLQEWMQDNLLGFSGCDNPRYTSGSGHIELRGNIDGPDFAKQMAQGKFHGFAINPMNVTANEVSLRIIPLREPDNRSAQPETLERGGLE
jgi:hypothetical protein